MAKGLVGGVNSARQSTSTSSITGTAGVEQTYTAKINNVAAYPVEYTGRESDSLIISVDNASKTISGEVKWQNMIATSESEEDAYHAYPANKARLNFEEIGKSLTSLKSDVKSLDEACDGAADTILKYVQNLASIESELDECKKYCTQLRAALNQEISTRELDHVSLRRTASENFDTLKRDISGISTTMVERLDTQEGTIQLTRNDIAAEVARAKSEEDRLDQSLKVTNRFVSENKQGIAALRQDAAGLVSRIQVLESADVVNQTVDHTAAIQEIRQTLADTDLRLSSQLNTTAKDTTKIRDLQYKHESAITGLTASLKTAEIDVENLKEESRDLKTAVTDLQSRSAEMTDSNANEHAYILTSVYNEAEVRRETDAYHEDELRRLEVRISTLQTELTQVIQALANELRNRDAELQESLTNISYDFVDAGNAPV